MKIGDDDFSDLVTYFSNLFRLKKMRTIQVDKYAISYEGCDIFKGNDTDDVVRKNGFPEMHDIDRIRSIIFSVTGIIPNMEISVKVSWDYVEFTPDPDPIAAEDFLNQLDRSTFRYF